MTPRILIASPVQQKPFILAYFLFALRSLKKEGLHVDYLFIDDNTDTQSAALLKKFQTKVNGVTIFQSETPLSYIRDEVTHYWNEHLIDKVAQMKDQMIDYAIEHQYDALFLIDSDLMVHPETLMQLVAAQKEIISSIFWTKWRQQDDPLPQVWMMDEYSFATSQGEKEMEEAADFLKKMRTPGVYEVGGLGACTLIRREALLKGVRFQKLPNLSFWGEDRHFCIRAAALNIPLFVDTHYPAYHIYRESDLVGAEQFKSEIINDQTKNNLISLCMIVKDEEEVLARCLSTVSDLVDEIIIVDTGSKDRTKEIAAQFTDKIFDFEWIDDFAAARNFSFDQATSDYIFWLDADDILTEENRKKFKQLKSKLATEQVDRVMMHYHLAFDEDGRPTSSLKRNRLVKRDRHFRWIGVVHEYLAVYGEVMQSDIAITHRKEKPYTDRNLKIYRKHEEKGAVFTPRDLYYFGNELKDHQYYEEAIEKYEQFLSTKQGWVEDEIAACLKLADCYGVSNERDLQLAALFRSFKYGLPRAECYCRIGAFFMEEHRYEEAIYWYEQATKLNRPSIEGGLIEHAAWTWLPYLQMCVCYDRLGQYQKAYECNERALQHHPTHPSMLHNKKYFEEKVLHS